MLKLSISAESEKFRAEVRDWLKRNPPPSQSKDPGLENFITTGRKWQARLASPGFVATHWPKEFGGRGLSLVEEAIVQEELSRAGSPQLLGLFGLTMVGPVLIRHGTKRQKDRYLKKILTAEEIWCQGFSEPEAGSDLAAIKTKAAPTGDGFLVSGQKIWTSFAQIADWCFLLCRTSHEDQKHKGMSYLLVDMKAKGITVRPLKQISGDDEFNEVFFDSVFVPQENVVGEVGEGWKIAISTLMYERVVLTFARMLQSEVTLRELIKKNRNNPNQVLKGKLAEAVAKSSAVRALAYSHLLSYTGNPPKEPGPEGSMDKLFWSETFQEISKLALEYLGANAALNESDPHFGTEMHRYLYSRGRSIAAGTSEIQRNIIADRVLKLPK